MILLTGTQRDRLLANGHHLDQDQHEIIKTLGVGSDNSHCDCSPRPAARDFYQRTRLCRLAAWYHVSSRQVVSRSWG
jgi:hypothetical protein